MDQNNAIWLTWEQAETLAPGCSPAYDVFISRNSRYADMQYRLCKKQILRGDFLCIMLSTSIALGTLDNLYFEPNAQEWRNIYYLR